MEVHVKAKEQARRARLVANAQDKLDGQLGQEIIAPFVGLEVPASGVDDFTCRRIARAATKKLHEEADGFREMVVSVEPRGKLVQLTARFAVRR
jgi:hypothetical protein